MSEQRKEIRAALLKAAAPKRDRGREALALGIDSLTGGWGDEIVGAVGGEGEGRRFRADRKAFAKNNPEIDLVAQLGGGIVAPGAVAGRALMKAPMAGGAALGALYGGSGGHDEVTSGDRVKGAFGGAAIGGILGGAGHGLKALRREHLRDTYGEQLLVDPKRGLVSYRKPLPTDPAKRAEIEALLRKKIARTNGAPQNAAPKMGGDMLRDSGARGYKPTTEPKAPGTDIWDKYNGKTPPQMAARTSAQKADRAYQREQSRADFLNKSTQDIMKKGRNPSSTAAARVPGKTKDDRTIGKAYVNGSRGLLDRLEPRIGGGALVGYGLFNGLYEIGKHALGYDDKPKPKPKLEMKPQPKK